MGRAVSRVTVYISRVTVYRSSNVVGTRVWVHRLRDSRVQVTMCRRHEKTV